MAQSGLERVHDALALAALDPQAVEHDREGAVLGVKPRVLDRHRNTELEHAPKAGLLERLAHDRGGDLPAHPVRERHQGGPARSAGDECLEDGGRRVAPDRLAAPPAVEHGRPRVERAQVVGVGRHGGDGGARGAARGSSDRRPRGQDTLEAPGCGRSSRSGTGARRARRSRRSAGALPRTARRARVRVAGPRDPGYRGDRPDRDPDAGTLQVVLARTDDLEEATGDPARISGTGTPRKRAGFSPGRTCPGGASRDTPRCAARRTSGEARGSRGAPLTSRLPPRTRRAGRSWRWRGRRSLPARRAGSRSRG